MAAGAIACFGTLDDGRVVEAATLRNGAGLTARILTYGATIQALETQDRHTVPGDIVLGYPIFADYLARPQFFGAAIGRFANRIRGGRFRLDGSEHQVPATDGDHALHGGRAGFDKRLWTITSHAARALTLRLVSADGEEGFPGALDVELTYTLAEQENALTIGFMTRTDRPTIVNLTNHSYFNLAGEGHGIALDHVLTIDADHVTPVDATLIPTGELMPVAGTALDFGTPRRIAERIREARDEQIFPARGDDFNYVLRDGVAAIPRPAVRVEEPASGRVLTIETIEPGAQFYSGNFLDATMAGNPVESIARATDWRSRRSISPTARTTSISRRPASTRASPGRTTTIWRFTTSTPA